MTCVDLEHSLILGAFFIGSIVATVLFWNDHPVFGIVAAIGFGFFWFVIPILFTLDGRGFYFEVACS